MKPRKHWWVWILTGLYIYFIFSNSLQTASQSNNMSYAVTYRLMDILNHFGMYCNFDVFHHYIRKLAHFSEFALLGFLVTFSMHLCPLFKSRFLNFTVFLLGIPFADEMLQRLSDGRSSQVTDMLIDASGFLFGGFVCYVLFLIIKDLFFRKKKAA